MASSCPRVVWASFLRSGAVATAPLTSMMKIVAAQRFHNSKWPACMQRVARHYDACRYHVAVMLVHKPPFAGLSLMLLPNCRRQHAKVGEEGEFIPSP